MLCRALPQGDHKLKREQQQGTKELPLRLERMHMPDPDQEQQLNQLRKKSSSLAHTK